MYVFTVIAFSICTYVCIPHTRLYNIHYTHTHTYIYAYCTHMYGTYMYMCNMICIRPIIYFTNFELHNSCTHVLCKLIIYFLGKKNIKMRSNVVDSFHFQFRSVCCQFCLQLHLFNSIFQLVSNFDNCFLKILFQINC